jgi:hypothetical protein
MLRITAVPEVCRLAIPSWGGGSLISRPPSGAWPPGVWSSCTITGRTRTARVSGQLPAETRWPGSPTLTAISCRSPSSCRSTKRRTRLPLVVCLRRSSWSADMCGITCPDAERAEGPASGLPGSCQAGAVLVADDRQVRPERGYGLQGAGPQLSGAKPGAEQVQDSGDPGGGADDDPATRSPSRRQAKMAQRGSGSSSGRNSGPEALSPCAHAASHRPSSRAPVTLTQDKPSWPGPAGAGVQAIQSASNSSVKPSGTRSRRAKLSLTAQRRDRSRTCAISAAPTSGHKTIAFGYKSSPWSALVYKRALNTPGWPCDRQTASHHSALLVTAAPSSA